MAGFLSPGLKKVESEEDHAFEVPAKKIDESHDLPTFFTTRAYHDIMTFLTQLNHSMFPVFQKNDQGPAEAAQLFPLNSPHVSFSSPVIELQHLLGTLSSMVDEVPPDSGPRRFGNISFRIWYELLEQRALSLLEQHLPSSVRSFKYVGDVSPASELQAYLLGSFGNAQRLDYGTGHELSFLAFLGGIWKLGGFAVGEPSASEREIVLGVIEPYLELVRKIIKTYTLEPAGSHGVWGLDDHSFLPYIFGSAQYGPAIRPGDPTPIEGSHSDSPEPSAATNASVVASERTKNMYFSAIGFIYDVKKGPFWEHSPYLYDISGITAGWGKVNKGMLKMYNAEVLAKFPVVQHFPFGSLFKWERDPTAIDASRSAHISHQPAASKPNTRLPAPSGSLPTQRTTMPAQVSQQDFAMPQTKAPWAK